MLVNWDNLSQKELDKNNINENITILLLSPLNLYKHMIRKNRFISKIQNNLVVIRGVCHKRQWILAKRHSKKRVPNAPNVSTPQRPAPEKPKAKTEGKKWKKQTQFGVWILSAPRSGCYLQKSVLHVSWKLKDWRCPIGPIWRWENTHKGSCFTAHWETDCHSSSWTPNGQLLRTRRSIACWHLVEYGLFGLCRSTVFFLWQMFVFSPLWTSA